MNPTAPTLSHPDFETFLAAIPIIRSEAQLVAPKPQRSLSVTGLGIYIEGFYTEGAYTEMDDTFSISTVNTDNSSSTSTVSTHASSNSSNFTSNGFTNTNTPRLNPKAPEFTPKVAAVPKPRKMSEAEMQSELNKELLEGSTPDWDDKRSEAEIQAELYAELLATSVPEYYPHRRYVGVIGYGR